MTKEVNLMSFLHQERKTLKWQQRSRRADLAGKLRTEALA